MLDDDRLIRGNEIPFFGRVYRLGLHMIKASHAYALTELMGHFSPSFSSVVNRRKHFKSKLYYSVKLLGIVGEWTWHCGRLFMLMYYPILLGDRGTFLRNL